MVLMRMLAWSKAAIFSLLMLSTMTFNFSCLFFSSFFLQIEAKVLEEPYTLTHTTHVVLDGDRHINLLQILSSQIGQKFKFK